MVVDAVFEYSVLPKRAPPPLSLGGCVGGRTPTSRITLHLSEFLQESSLRTCPVDANGSAILAAPAFDTADKHIEVGLCDRHGASNFHRVMI